MGMKKQQWELRKAGSPAGSHHHLPWWICVFYDPYERINFHSHFWPGVAFLVLGFLALNDLVLGGKSLALFCAASATTHLLSAITHVWPDSHLLEKCDHIGITALILGTPLTALLAKDPADSLAFMGWVGLALVAAAFLRPVLRTSAFVVLGLILFLRYNVIMNMNLCLQIVLYLSGGYAFVRNGGHDRWPGFTDHHLLHYYVTVGTFMHVFYIRQAVTHAVSHSDAWQGV